jgi:pentatricopeptide repeat protein
MSLLQSCAKKKDLQECAKIHADAVKNGLLSKDLYIANTLVSLYAKCGDLVKSREVFDQIPNRNVVSWTALIASYAQHGHGEEALKLFDQMQVIDGFSPDPFTYACILKACGTLKETKKGQQIHGKVEQEGLLMKNVLVGTALIDMYAKCGELSKAQDVFDEIPVRNVVSWTSLISGYSQHGYGQEALCFYDGMIYEGLSPNVVTFICVLKACASIGAIEKGNDIHVIILREGMLEKNIALGTALIDMYAKCDALSKAKEVFDALQAHNVISWTALITGYAQKGHGHETLVLFDKMQSDGVRPNEVTLSCVLKACGSIGALEKGKEIHAEISRRKCQGKDPLVGNALVDMYAKCGELAQAQKVFDELPIRDVVSWTALISGYVQGGDAEEALNCFEQMLQGGFSPNSVTFLCILNACSSLGSIGKGKEIHNDVLREGLLKKHSLLGNALVDMYAKCGLLIKAQEVFDELPVRDVTAWTTLIAGYAQLGRDELVVELLKKMLEEGMEPNGVTLTVMINACSHAGLPDIGHIYYEALSTCFGIIPSSEHYACLVDLFSRAGQFDEVMMVIKNMPIRDYLPVWNALLGACQRCGNVGLGRSAFEHAIQLDEKDAAPYVSMRNIYVSASMQGDADGIEALRLRNGAWKEKGCYSVLREG